MASADEAYADPSALLKLYIHQPESAAMSAWRGRIRRALPLTLHGRVEIVNAICLAAFRKDIESDAMNDALASFGEDLTEGRYLQADAGWRAVLRRAGELSREYAASLGCRSLDVLHVASALDLGLRRFLTFDRRQQRLAEAVGLRLIVPE